MDKFLNKFVKVYKSIYNFSVVIGNDVFEMSTNACQPNGVNLYSGEIDEYDFDPVNEIPLADASDDMKRAIVTRIKFEYNGFSETD